MPADADAFAAQRADEQEAARDGEDACSVTPQTNADLPAIAQALAERDDVAISGHVSPDGDCLGSQLVLAHALRTLGKRATCVLATDEPYDEKLGIHARHGRDGAGLVLRRPRGRSFVAVDVPTVERMGDAAALHDAAALTVTVDHHAVPTAMADLTYVDPDVAATAMIVWELAALSGREARRGHGDLRLHRASSPTPGRFQYQSTDAAALAAAADMVAAGADPALVARHVYQSRSLASAAAWKAPPSGRMRLSAGGQRGASAGSPRKTFARFAPPRSRMPSRSSTPCGPSRACGWPACCATKGDMVRGSFRAKDGTNVAELAAAFGGGGHKAAAGFTVQAPIDEAVAQVTALLDQAFPEDVPTCPGAPGGPDTSGGAKGAQGGPAAGTSKGGGAVVKRGASGLSLGRGRGQAGGHELPRRGEPLPRASSARSASGMPARSTRSPRACCPSASGRPRVWRPSSPSTTSTTA